MNIKNSLFGLACVLAVMAAAQPVHAQFISHAERAAMRTGWQVKAEKAQPKQQQAAQQAQEKKNAAAVIASQDAKRGCAPQNSDCSWSVAEKLGKALKESSKTAVTYGAVGPESYVITPADLIWVKSASATETASSTNSKVQSQQDSLSKALEKANLKAVQNAAKK